MSRVWQYLLERFHPGLLGPITLILALGCLKPFNFLNWLVIAGSLFLYLFQLRLFDEFKDADFDKKHYPTRPVPRGLVSFGELNQLLVAVLTGQIILLIISNASWPIFFWLQTYTWFMRWEFGVKKWLRQHFTVYLLSHEVVVVPLFIYLMSMSNWFSITNALLMGLGVFGLEIARKTTPGRIGVGDTYLEQYGLMGTQILATGIISVLTVLGYISTESIFLVVPGIVLTILLTINLKWLAMSLAAASIYWIVAVSLWHLV